MSPADVAVLLELVASERPDLLRPLVKALEYSPAGGGVAELAKQWNVPPSGKHAGKLVVIAATTAQHLDRLERKRRNVWRHPREVVDSPNVLALHSFAHGRRDRARFAALRVLDTACGRRAEGWSWGSRTRTKRRAETNPSPGSGTLEGAKRNARLSFPTSTDSRRPASPPWRGGKPCPGGPPCTEAHQCSYFSGYCLCIPSSLFAS